MKFLFLTFLAISISTNAMDINLFNSMNNPQYVVSDSKKEEDIKYDKPLCSNPKDVKLCAPSVERQLAFNEQISRIDMCKNVDLTKIPSCSKYRTKSKYLQLLEWSKSYPKYKSYHPEYCACFRY